MSKLVLVKNIRFNDNKPFELHIPDVYSYESIVQEYLRTAVFNAVDIDYDFEIIEDTTNIQTSYPMHDTHSYMPDLYDDSHKLSGDIYKVTPFNMNSLLIVIDDIYNDPDMKQNIYEVLLAKLNVIFMYE